MKEELPEVEREVLRLLGSLQMEWMTYREIREYVGRTIHEIKKREIIAALETLVTSGFVKTEMYTRGVRPIQVWGLTHEYMTRQDYADAGEVLDDDY
jgi:phosphopantetheine adenylyltransferase